MPRPKLPDGKRKVRMPITVDKEVAEAAKASGNASEWVNAMCKIAMKIKNHRRKV